MNSIAPSNSLLIAYVVYCIYYRLMWIGWRKSLVYTDLPDLNEQDKTKMVIPSFMKYWDYELNKSG